jgi:hypothetical protein
MWLLIKAIFHKEEFLSKEILLSLQEVDLTLLNYQFLLIP